VLREGGKSKENHRGRRSKTTEQKADIDWLLDKIYAASRTGSWDCSCCYTEALWREVCRLRDDMDELSDV